MFFQLNNSKKFLPFVLALLNFNSSTIASTFVKLDHQVKSKDNTVNWTKILKKDLEDKPSKVTFKKSTSQKGSFSSDNNLANNLQKEKGYQVINVESQKEALEIQSDSQSEENEILYAEGNVIVKYKGNVLRTNNLIYDKVQETIRAEGDISLLIGNQFFQIDRIEYDFVTEKGYLYDVKGFVNTDELFTDLEFDYDDSKYDSTSIAKQLKKTKVLHTPKEVNNWIFSTKQVSIDGATWLADNALLTNDLLETDQVEIRINSLKILVEKDRLRLRSAINYLVLDDNLTIPFWFGERSIRKFDEGFEFQNKWNIGFDKVDKDGYFIGRRLSRINLSDNFTWDLEPQFLLQRSLQGYTKSFVTKDHSITENKVKRNVSLSDYFGLNSNIDGTINKWNIKIEKKLNSFDMQKISEALRFRGELSQEINFFDSAWENQFYGVYRDRIWNGSIGEAEIYEGLGWKLAKQNAWVANDVEKNEYISFGLGNFTAEELNNKNLKNSFKGSIFYSLDQKFPINSKSLDDKYVDESYNYIYEPIRQGFFLNTKISSQYNVYEKNKHQEYIGFGAGPEIVYGTHKKYAFDYTRFSFLPFYKLKSGESIFKYDQISDKFTLDIAYDQHLVGPILLKTSGKLNLDNHSNDYGEFIDSKISLNWKKRTYEFGIFYQPHEESGGLTFSLYGFK